MLRPLEPDLCRNTFCREHAQLVSQLVSQFVSQFVWCWSPSLAGQPSLVGVRLACLPACVVNCQREMKDKDALMHSFLPKFCYLGSIYFCDKFCMQVKYVHMDTSYLNRSTNLPTWSKLSFMGCSNHLGSLSALVCSSFAGRAKRLWLLAGWRASYDVVEGWHCEALGVR